MLGEVEDGDQAKYADLQNSPGKQARPFRPSIKRHHSHLQGLAATADRGLTAEPPARSEGADETLSDESVDHRGGGLSDNEEDDPKRLHTF